ncbi:hypothetical protein K466DRAFT_667017 [Polyporus arcularius HHB13444]|uniref:NADP-dependent oxidoreductase domain-containing protein n=1 Tax=Polyporus arcularius HHB13444 TaxID=1314778 RepID=A0A5C3NVW3_9APHY|nr:hypothetical protein K466DRAFT_667017 [Polyporus arcularius HHB13444]
MDPPDTHVRERVPGKQTSTDLTDRAKALFGSPFEKKLRESDIQILRRVEELAHKKGWSMSQVALAWIAAKVTSPIVGVNKMERLQELYEVQKPRF